MIRDTPVLAGLFEHAGKRHSANTILRKEFVGGLVLVAGAHVQKDRIEVEVVAYGRRMQSWSVDYRVFEGDTSQLDGPGSPWRHLDALLGEVFHHAVGGPGMRVQRLAVDAGYNTNTVYQWVRRQAANRVIAVDGRDTYQMIIGQPKAVEFNERGRRECRGVKLWPVGTSLARTVLYGWLKQARTGEEKSFGWCHFPAYNDEYFRQLTAEEIVPRLVKGYRKLHWEKVYNRNEALGCRVYASSAAALEGVDRWSEEQWREQEAALGIPIKSMDMAAATGGRDPLAVSRPKATRADDPYL
jgi:phage terminase large subunit GpA-like protein